MKSFNLYHNKITLSKALVIIIIFIATTLLILFLVGSLDEDEYVNDEAYSEGTLSASDSGCNMAGIKVRGDLVIYTTEAVCDEDGYIIEETSSEEIIDALNIADKKENIKAILLEIESSGGSPLASEEVNNALKRVEKPVIALIRTNGTSAAYYIATGADIIFASKVSHIGSIGTTMSYLDYAGQNRQEGITYNQLSTGKFKDSGDPDKPLTAEEKALFMRDINKITEYFIEDVANNRNLEIEKVRALADGSSMMGEMALENGLIDRIGGLYDVKEYVKEMIGEEVEVCW
jgi:protease-4